MDGTGRVLIANLKSNVHLEVGNLHSVSKYVFLFRTASQMKSQKHILNLIRQKLLNNYDQKQHQA